MTPAQGMFMTATTSGKWSIVASALSTIIAITSGCRAPSPAQLAPVLDTPQYTLDVRVRPSDSALDVTGTLTLPPHPQRRDSLVISLSERATAFALDVQEPGTAVPMAIQRVSLPPRERVPGERRSAKWVARFTNGLPPNQPVTLRFSTRIEGGTDFLYHVGHDLALATGWGDRWYPSVDGVYGLGTGTIAVHVPRGWQVMTGADAVQSAAEQNAGTFRFSQKYATYFTFVAGPYSIVQGEKHDGLRVNAWVLSPRARMPQHLEGAATMMRVLESEFGPNPFGELTLVEVPRAIALAAGFNAFSPVGFLVLNSNSFNAPTSNQYEWLGHEMGHQWFPHSISFDDTGFPFLEEALAEYGGIRIVHALAGDDAVRRLRTTGFEFDPIYSAAAYFRLVAAGVDEPLATMGTGINERNLAYNKGALMFDMLSREVGPAKFRVLLRGLTAGRRLQSITWQQFRAAVDSVAGQDMQWFFDQWLTRTGAPEFNVSWSQRDGAVRGAIGQQAPYYRTRLRIDAHGEQGERVTHIVVVDGASTSFNFPAAFAVTRVEIDPMYEVLRWTPEFRAMVDSVRR